MAAQLEDLTQELIDMRLSIEGLEKERDFYFGKLRDIEVSSDQKINQSAIILSLHLSQVVIQEGAEAADPLASKILEVLYATEDGFAVPDDEDVPLPNHDF